MLLLTQIYTYKLSIEKQQSIVDAWSLDLQNDI